MGCLRLIRFVSVVVARPRGLLFPWLRLSTLLLLFLPGLATAEPALPVITHVEAQPLRAQAQRVVQALALVGAPLTKSQRQQFEAALNEPADDQGVARIQAVLDPLCLALVSINPESRVKVAPGRRPRPNWCNMAGGCSWSRSITRPA